MAVGASGAVSEEVGHSEEAEHEGEEYREDYGSQEGEYEYPQQVEPPDAQAIDRQRAEEEGNREGAESEESCKEEAGPQEAQFAADVSWQRIDASGAAIDEEDIIDDGGDTPGGGDNGGDTPGGGDNNSGGENPGGGGGVS